MKKIFLILILSFLAQNAFSQDYKQIRTYEGSNWMTLSDVLIEDDTAYIFGGAFDTLKRLQGIYMGKMDEAGTIVDERLMTRDGYILEYYRHGTVDIEGDSIAMVHGNFISSAVPVKVVGKNLGVGSVLEYPEVIDYRVVRDLEIATIDNGYLVKARKQGKNYKVHSFLRKVDKKGYTYWDRPSTDWCAGESIGRLSGGENYVLHYGMSQLDKKNPQTWWFRIYDKQGELQRDTFFVGEERSANWLGEGYIDDDLFFVSSLGIDEDLIIDPEIEDYVVPILRAYNHDFDLEWEFVYGDIRHTGATGVESIIPTQDGHYLATLMHAPKKEWAWQFESTGTPVIFLKFDKKGRILWEARYDLMDTEGMLAIHRPMSTAEHSDGSLVTVGEIQYWDTSFYKNHAFVMKIDKDGCFNGDCSLRRLYTSTTTPLFETVRPFLLSPNPATTEVYLTLSDHDTEDLNYGIYDMSGRMVQEGRITSSQTRLSVSTLVSGVYLVHVYTGSRLVGRERLVVE